jgi:hypothetical protein
MQWQLGLGVLKMMHAEFAGSGAICLFLLICFDLIVITLIRLPFDGCCPDCKMPGDDCPIGDQSDPLTIQLTSIVFVLVWVI